jgi:hypothetical protein
MTGNNTQIQIDKYRSRGAVRYVLLVFMIGIFLGYGIAVLQSKISKDDDLSDGPKQDELLQNLVKDSALTSELAVKVASINDAIVNVELDDAIDDNTYHAVGIVTAQDYTLILPIPAVNNQFT